MKWLRPIIIICSVILVFICLGHRRFDWVFGVEVILISWIVNWITTTPSRQRKRDEELWNKWNSILDKLKNDPLKFRFCKVDRIRQHAKTGTKAYVT